MVYFVAFGAECVAQFVLCANSIREVSGIDIVLVTDMDVDAVGAKVIRVDAPKAPPNGDPDPDKAQYHAYFTYRTIIHKLIDVTKWDRVWYMDTDFMLTDDLFGKYSDAEHVWLCNEPGTYVNDIHFSLALTPDEVNRNPFAKGINAGVYSVPRKHYGFFTHYHRDTMAMITRSERAWLCEQHVINAIRVRNGDQYNIRTFEDGDIGFPAKKVQGLMAQHYACYKFNDKLKLMDDEAARRIARN